MASETPSTRDDGRLSQARRGASYVSVLKIPVALFCVFGIGIAGDYFIYVKQQTQYVAGRNFRVRDLAAPKNRLPARGRSSGAS